MDNENCKINELAWNQFAYEAWCERFGTPYCEAIKIKKDPILALGGIYPYLKEVKNKKIANLLGSNGIKGVALSLLGANVTIVDISSENERYAKDLAREAGVNLEYIVSDVLKLKEELLNMKYDIVFMEMGILHYFTDLNPLFMVANKMLKDGGEMIIQDFHPISTKLITLKGKKYKVTGNYFENDIHEVDVAYLKYVPGIEDISPEDKNAFIRVRERRWTLGEIVTAVGEEGFRIKKLNEAPGYRIEDKGIPKIFTLCAEK